MTTMLNKTSIAILAAAAIFGAASAAQADGGSKNDAEQQDLGQMGHARGAYAFVPRHFRGGPSSAYAYAPRSRLERHWRYEGVGKAPAGEHHSSKPPEGGSGKLQ